MGSKRFLHQEIGRVNAGDVARRVLSRSRHTIWSNHRMLSAVPIPARYVASDLGPAGSVSPGFFFGSEWQDRGHRARVALVSRAYHVI